jgi:hypothetical protein
VVVASNMWKPKIAKVRVKFGNIFEILKLFLIYILIFSRCL